MADEKLQVNVDFTNYPELYEALEKLVKKQDTDRSKLIRGLVRKEVVRQAKINATWKAIERDINRQ